MAFNYDKDYVKIAHERLRCVTIAPPNPSRCRLCLIGSTAGLSTPPTKAQLIANELPAANGYTRKVLGYAIDSVSSSLITISNHELTTGAEVFYVPSVGATPDSGLAINTRYFVVNSALNQVELSATLGGTPITIATPGTGERSLIVSGVYNATSKRFESLPAKVSFTSSGAGFSFIGCFILEDANTAAGDASGVLVGHEIFASPYSPMAGQTQALKIPLYVSNQAGNNGV